MPDVISVNSQKENSLSFHRSQSLVKHFVNCQKKVRNKTETAFPLMNSITLAMQ